MALEQDEKVLLPWSSKPTLEVGRAQQAKQQGRQQQGSTRWGWGKKCHLESARRKEQRQG